MAIETEPRDERFALRTIGVAAIHANLLPKVSRVVISGFEGSAERGDGIAVSASFG